ncbi:putative transposase [Fibrobacter succinogenes subsp. elongatus]|jgi:putative transposase|uniref:Putative transposase n=1 Tax=Fibrobacter succinogenes TaxID=833 RepID=A0A380RVC2_FIBSU|nr:putative transposase [Fibrobacter succinogenes subsp. elongatus]SUQ19251.1 putative transposase [Fibrobacter succinogenes]
MKKLTHSESEIVKSVNELEASQLKKLKELEEENAKLKKMYANLALDNEILREVIEKKL